MNRLPILIIALSLLAGCATNSAPVDGLVRLNAWNTDQVWIKPGFEPAKYSKIVTGDSGIDFRDVDEHYTSNGSSSKNYPLSAAEQEKYRRIVVEEFSKELKKVAAYQFTNKAGSDTLTLSIQVLDVVSTVPPIRHGRTPTYLYEVGQATLALILSDSVTGETLISVADRRSAVDNDGLMLRKAVPSNNWSAVRKMARQWAVKLRKSLAEIKASTATPSH